MILIFEASNLCTDICKTIFVILEVQFHHEGGLSESRYLELFSQDSLYFHHAKNQPSLRPRSTFSEHWPWFWQYLLSKKVTKKFGTKFGSWSSQKVQNFLFGGFNQWEISVYFGPLFVLVKTPLDALTNSALCARCFTFYIDIAVFLKHCQNIESLSQRHNVL